MAEQLDDVDYHIADVAEIVDSFGVVVVAGNSLTVQQVHWVDQMERVNPLSVSAAYTAPIAISHHLPLRPPH